MSQKNQQHARTRERWRDEENEKEPERERQRDGQNILEFLILSSCPVQAPIYRHSWVQVLLFGAERFPVQVFMFLLWRSSLCYCILGPLGQDRPHTALLSWIGRDLSGLWLMPKILRYPKCQCRLPWESWYSSCRICSINNTWHLGPYTIDTQTLSLTQSHAVLFLVSGAEGQGDYWVSLLKGITEVLIWLLRVWVIASTLNPTPKP